LIWCGALQRSGHIITLREAESCSLNLDLNERGLYLDPDQRLLLRSVNGGEN
jgi:hypothetical protein